jgi:hypothetical protein
MAGTKQENQTRAKTWIQEEDETVTTTISGVPAELLEEIDALALIERRSRSSFLVGELERIVAERKKQRAKR